MATSIKAAGTARPARKPVKRKAEPRPQPEGIRDLVSQLKRERILSAAIALFYEQGYAQTTLDQVAKALGVTKPFIYQYFDSKNALLVEICSRAIRNANDTLARTMTQQGTASEKLQTVMRDFTLTVLENQANAVIYSREEKELAPKDREMIRTLRRGFDHRLVDLLEEGVRRGEFVIEDLHLTAKVIGSIVGWSPVWFRSEGRLTKEETAERLSTLVLVMVGARQPTPAPKPRRSRKAATAPQG